MHMHLAKMLPRFFNKDLKILALEYFDDELAVGFQKSDSELE